MTISTFSLPYSEQAVFDLRNRLERTRWPDTIERSGWTYGFDRDYLQEFCRYWAEDFDWKHELESFSSWKHSVAEVEGTTIHFVQERGRGSNVIPLLLL